MKTKEEILDNKFKERGIRKGWIDESKQAVLDAMEEYVTNVPQIRLVAEIITNLNKYTMKTFTELLERKIEGCDALGGLEREKAVYQSVLKDYKKQLILSGVSQQRKLLNALADDFNDSTDTYVGQKTIEKTLKAFNCG
tara:strand:- start:450 stop:866 length:417 start_codon:yes stop_codon:yes gene_type:complete